MVVEEYRGDKQEITWDGSVEILALSASSQEQLKEHFVEFKTLVDNGLSYEKLSKNGLMYRYNSPDDFGQPKSSFTICTFWMIKSLYLIGKKKQAIEMFEKVLQYSNHLGLFSEDIDFKTKRLLGNFPQAYSHLALIETAINISSGKLTNEEKLLESIH